MTILHENILSTKRLPKSPTWLFDSHVVAPSKLNIKLKTHSLTCLDIPLETFVGFNEMSSLFRNDHQKTMAGSVDLISEIPQQSTDDNFACCPTTKPLINIVSSDEQRPSIQQEYRPISKHRFRVSTSFITPTSLSDSVARLRRSRYAQTVRQSSLQTIDNLTERKHRSPLIRNGSIPKFSFRDLPALSRPVNHFEQCSQSRMSPFTSLPEIRSFVAQNCPENQQTINQRSKQPPLFISPSWKKSDSWSWKTSNAIQTNAVENQRMKPNVTLNEPPHQLDTHSRFELPVIIESPLQPRSSLQTIKQEYHLPPMRSVNKHRSNRSFRDDQIPRDSTRFYQKKNSFPHSISNYEVSSNRFSSQPTTRYPSTPLLAPLRLKNTDRFDYHPHQLHMTPLATFDDDDDDDNDSISSNSSFRSCIDSITEFSDMNTTEISSFLENSFPDMSSTYDLHAEVFDHTIKHSRSSVRHLCVLQ